jgi:hypothetical protein
MRSISHTFGIGQMSHRGSFGGFLDRVLLRLQLLGQPLDVEPPLLGRQGENVVVRPVQVVSEEEDLAAQPVLLSYEATKKFDMSRDAE